jgi:hypothetical protein
MAVASPSGTGQRRIVAITRTQKAQLTDDDLEHTRRVVGYARRHLGQGGPADDKEQSKWRYALMD